ncbi:MULTISPECIES: hypothetical protein [Niallia]|uniref:hypothetical protein n=1 Tax=Niallia TaxID=2837506 RepID=UPI00148F802D|nr:hypothetical protein [Niallia circulans]NRG29625.1 hypothetical protein [Niallia circulans]QJX62187.1 hypothetical protein HLK66_11355 [Niallia circulans]
MNVYWFGQLFWLLTGGAFLFFLIGLRWQSWEIVLISGILFFVPALYFLGANNWFRLLVIVPLIPFWFAFRIKKSM